MSLSCFMKAHIFKDKHKVAGDFNSLNLLVHYDMHCIHCLVKIKLDTQLLKFFDLMHNLLKNLT